MSENITNPIPTTPIIGGQVTTMIKTGQTIQNPNQNSTKPNKPKAFSIKENLPNGSNIYTLNLEVYIDASYNGEVKVMTDDTGLIFYAVSSAQRNTPPSEVTLYTYTNTGYTNLALHPKAPIAGYNTFESADSNMVDVGRTEPDPDDSDPFEGAVRPAGDGDH